MKRRQGFALPKNEENSELDMAPMLALMVTLIPILLLSSAFVHIMVVESSLPQLVAQAVEANKNIETKLSVFLEGKQVQIELSKAGGAPQRFAIKPVSGADGQAQIDLKGLNVTLSTIKAENANLFRAEIFPSANTLYEDVMKIMDEMRQSKSNQFPIPRPDGSQLMSDVMFPDVVFGNLLGDS